MAVLQGLSATTPLTTTAQLVDGVVLVNIQPTAWKTCVVTCEGSAPVVVSQPPQPNTLSLTPSTYGITTQNGTVQLVPTIKDQRGNVYTGSVTILYSSNDPRVTVSNTGLVTGVQTGGNATITAQVQGTSVSGTAAITTPAPQATTLTANAGYANIAAAANAAGQLVGFTVNDSYESHPNYAQNYQQMSGAGSVSCSEKDLQHWITSVNSTTSVTTNFSEFTQEYARLQAQGTKLLFRLLNGTSASQWPGLSTYCTSSSNANTLLTTIANAATNFFNTPGTPAAYSGTTAYSFGNTVTSGGSKWTCIVPSGTVTGVTPALGAQNTSGQYVWLKTQTGTIYAYNLLNEGIGGEAAPGAADSNPFSAQLGAPSTWLPSFAQKVYAGDPAKLYFNQQHYAYDGTGSGATAQGTAALAIAAACVTAGSVGGASNIIIGSEAHVICSVMQTTTSSSTNGFNAAQLTAFYNSITTAGYGYAITEFDVTDDMYEGSGSAGIPERLAAIGVAYTNYFACIAACTAKPAWVMCWQLRSPESWINVDNISPRSDGLTQYPNIYQDYNGTQTPAYTSFVTWLLGGSGSVGTITVNDNALHSVPMTLKDQWGFLMSLSTLSWSSSNATYIPVTPGGQYQALAGSETATITGSLASAGLSASVTVTSAAPALTALAVTPSTATLSSGTLQLSANEVDQYGVSWAGGGGAGGVWIFTTSGNGLSTNVSGVAAASNQLWCKMRIKVDSIRALGTWTGANLFTVDADGAGTNPKCYADIGTNGSSQFALTIIGYNTSGARSGGPVTPYVNLSALPANGNYILVYTGWDQTNNKYYVAVADENGNVINDGTNSASNAQSGNYGALNTTGGANGRITVNKCSISGQGQTTQALTWDGIAFYTNQPPTIGSGTTATCFAKPTTGDTGFAEGWIMGDATSGSISSGASMTGTHTMTLTNCTGGLSDAAGWSATSSPSLNWSSDNTAAAQVNATTGLVTFEGVGTANILAQLATNSTVSGVCALTCQTAPTLTTLTVSPTAMTLQGAGATGQITPTLEDQYENPFTGATVSYASSAPSIASVNASTGVVSWVAVGTATITTTATTASPAVTLTATTAVTTQAAASSNEPSGTTVIINTGTLTAVPATGASMGGAVGATFTMLSPSTASSVGEWSGNLTAVPSAQGTGLRIVYPPNLTGGNSPVRFQIGGWSSGFKTLYVRYKVRYSSNWTNNGNVGTKMFEPQFANSNNSGNENHVIGGWCDNPPQTDQYLVTALQFPKGTSSFRQMPAPGLSTYAAVDPNGQLAGPTRGNWHTVECLYTPQSSVTSSTATSDGTCSMWVDGVQSFTATNVFWVGPGDSQLWSFWLMDPTYGGGSNSPPSVSPNICWDFDQLYVSGK